MTAVALVRKNIQKSWKPFLAVSLLTAIIMGVVFLLGAQYGVSVRDLTRDPAASTGYPAYIGFVSQLGILVWSASAAACLLAYNVVSRQQPEPGEVKNSASPFFLCSALLTLMLGVDDAFMLHDRVFPHFNIHELIVYGSYAVVVLLYLVVFARLLLRTEFLLLLAALGFFGMSLITDLMFDPKYSPFWIEDGSKMIGILCWFAFYFRTAAASLKGDLQLEGLVAAATVRPRYGPQTASTAQFRPVSESKVVLSRRKSC